MKTEPSDLSLFFMIILSLFLYCMPIFVSIFRKVRNSGGIIALNLLLGWTFLGWIIALIWAFTAETQAQAEAKAFDYTKLAATMNAAHAPVRDAPAPFQEASTAAQKLASTAASTPLPPPPTPYAR